jgi:hypothetical protein
MARSQLDSSVDVVDTGRAPDALRFLRHASDESNKKTKVKRLRSNPCHVERGDQACDQLGLGTWKGRAVPRLHDR